MGNPHRGFDRLDVITQRTALWLFNTIGLLHLLVVVAQPALKAVFELIEQIAK